MKSVVVILSLLLAGIPACLDISTEDKLRIFSSLSYYGSDFDGDGIGDLAVWNRRNGTLYYQLSSNGEFYKKKFFDGKLRYNPVFADYDGDKITDFAFFHIDTGQWIIYKSTNPTIAEKSFFGSLGDVPVPVDFDGDLTYEQAVWRPTAGLWFKTVRDPSGNMRPLLFEIGNYQDSPTSADFDGDGKSDLTVWRPDDGKWYIFTSSKGYKLDRSKVIVHGKDWDITVPADYNGDKITDLAFWRAEDKTWYIKYSLMDDEQQIVNSDQETAKQVSYSDVKRIQFGEVGDIPAALDTNGDGSPELVMWNPKLKSWRILDLTNDRTNNLKWNVEEGCVPAISILYRFD